MRWRRNYDAVGSFCASASGGDGRLGVASGSDQILPKSRNENGKGSWSGYGPRPRGKGIVDQCCRSSGCELYHLEMYCAKPKAKQLTTRSPTTTSTTATHTTTAVLDMFEDVFRKRLLETLGAPNSPQREAYRKKTPSSLPWKSKMSSPPPRVRVNVQNSTSWPPSASGRSV
ncbi:insulin-like growth factor I isoform X2 [Xiphophorus maculatus]|uniref:insulin-like growth factor I isoform X2 n=1 Tax=Xiphophorus maculatus TaxID=8083 RepID=UPI000C6DD863|nr:insulin-like growth factor I isoform X2 [Xiphophorus maculatus]